MHTCIHSHRLKRCRHSCPRRVIVNNKNTSSMHYPRRQTVTTSIVGLKKKRVKYTKVSPKMVNPRDLAENAEEEKGRPLTGSRILTSGTV